MSEGEECPLDPSHSGIYVNLLENPERFTGYGGSINHSPSSSALAVFLIDKVSFLVSVRDTKRETRYCAQN